MKRLLLPICLLLLISFCAAAAEEEAALVRCAYISGETTMTLAPGDDGDVLTVSAPDGESLEYPASRYALSDLGRFLAGYAPENWPRQPDLPQVPEGPYEAFTAVYGDGSQYTLSSAQEPPEGWEDLMWAVSRFLISYTAEAETAQLVTSSFDGGGPEYRLNLSRGEVVDWYSYRDYGQTEDEPAAPGSAYDIVYVFRGRVPGETEAWFETDFPFEPIEEETGEGGYILSVDEDFNVTVKERE